MRRHETGQRTAEQDSAKHARHDGADHGAAPFGRGKLRGEGDDLLRYRRGHAEQQRGDQQHRCRRCQRGTDEGERQHGELRDDQTAALNEIAQWYEREQADGISELGRGRNQSSEAAGKIALDHTEHRLIVVDVRHGQSGGDRH